MNRVKIFTEFLDERCERSGSSSDDTVNIVKATSFNNSSGRDGSWTRSSECESSRGDSSDKREGAETHGVWSLLRELLEGSRVEHLR